MPKDALRQSHVGILLNDRSSIMEGRILLAITTLIDRIQTIYGMQVERDDKINLSDIIATLTAKFSVPGKVAFTKATHNGSTYIKPDGGFLYIRDINGQRRCVLVTEAKRQGTNADRLAEGKKKQAKGNAIERLRKNMQGIDCMFAGEAITPFVCFGEGCDFADESSILDRVSTMNSFFPLNQIYVDKIYVVEPDPEIFKPTSLFFREQAWSPEEMLEIMWQVCQRSIAYYEGRYGLLKVKVVPDIKPVASE